LLLKAFRYCWAWRTEQSGGCMLAVYW